MDNLHLLIDLHQANPRQGPGDDAQTALALRLTGLDPASLGVDNFDAEYGALGISAADARLLQLVASEQWAAAAVPEPGTWAMMLAGLLFCGVAGSRRHMDRCGQFEQPVAR